MVASGAGRGAGPALPQAPPRPSRWPVTDRRVSAPAEGRDPLAALQVKVGVKTQRCPDPRRTPRAAHPGRRPPGRQ